MGRSPLTEANTNLACFWQIVTAPVDTQNAAAQQTVLRVKKHQMFFGC